jgi:hypothetical protein
MPILKNNRYEAVAQAYVLDPHKVGWKAYKLVYPKASQRGCENGFCLLMKNDEFSGRISELQCEAAQNVEITLESLLREAEELRQLGVRLNQPSAAVSALKLKSELSGHYVQRKETTVKHDPTDYETAEIIAWLSQFAARGDGSEDEAAVEGQPDIVH